LSAAAFISYSREDSEFALRLAQDLKAAGAPVWLDQLDLKPGASWDNSIEDALKEAPEMIVILSPSSVRSENVRDEISFALKQGKTVVPVLYKECDIPLRLERKQHIDFRSDYARGLVHLLDHLRVARSGGDELRGAAEGAQQRLRQMSEKAPRRATQVEASRRRYPIVLYPKRAKTIFILITGLVLAAGSSISVVTSPAGTSDLYMGILGCIFFGLMILVALLMLFPGSSFLRLDDVGFTYGVLFRQRSRRWEEIESFCSVSLSTANKSVGWLLRPEFRSSGALYKVNRAVVGYDEALPQTYGGKSADELAELMNDCRVDALLLEERRTG
jgi:hypothetical protein